MYLKYESKNMVLAANDIQFDTKQFNMTPDEIRQMNNCRRFFSYAIQLLVPKYLDLYKAFMSHPLSREDQVRVLLAFIILIIVVTSLICENEMDALSEKVIELLESQHISEEIDLESVSDCYNDFYQ